MAASVDLYRFKMIFRFLFTGVTSGVEDMPAARFSIHGVETASRWNRFPHQNDGTRSIRLT